MGVRSGQDTVAVRLGIGHVGSAYPSPIKATQPWDIVFTQQPGQESLRSLSIAVTLEEDVEHETVLVHCSP